MSTMRPKGKRRVKWTYVQIGSDLEFQDDLIQPYAGNNSEPSELNHG